MWKRGKLAFCLIGTEVALMIIFALKGEYGLDANGAHYRHSQSPRLGGLEPNDNSIRHFYPAFVNCLCLALMALGLSFSYFANYTFSSFGFNALALSVAFQWSFVFPFLFESNQSHLKVDIITALKASWASIAVGISLSFVHGKASPLQLLIMSISEAFCFALNDHLLMRSYQVSDLAGGYRVCTFAAFFGSGTSIFLWRYTSEMRLKRLHTNVLNQLVVLISTVMVVIFWPSFTSSLASGNKQHRIVVNSILATSSAVITSFAASTLVDSRDRFSVRILHMGVISGAVSISGVAEFMIHPHVAILIGMLGVIQSVGSYVYVSPFFAKHLRIQDIFNSFSTFGIPSLFSAILNIAYSLRASEAEYRHGLYELFPARAPSSNSSELEEIITYFERVTAGDGRSSEEQAIYQAMAMATTLAISFSGGFLTSLIMKLSIFDPRRENELFNDSFSWLLPPQEQPTFIGNESNCELECSTGDDTCVPVQTLQLPPIKTRQQLKQSVSKD